MVIPLRIENNERFLVYNEPNPKRPEKKKLHKHERTKTKKS